MKWFLSNIKDGAWLALFALAIQFTLSFGHFHSFTTSQAAPAVQSGLTLPDTINAQGLAAAGVQATRQRSPANRDPDQRPADHCTICAVVAMASTVLLATTPLLLLPQAVEFLYLTTDAEFIHLKSAGVAFQPRAPPAS
jgi:hypothetical protein